MQASKEMAEQPIRVRSREGVEVLWSHKAARCSGMLTGMMDEAPTEEDVYPVPNCEVADLRLLGALCDP